MTNGERGSLGQRQSDRDEQGGTGQYREAPAVRTLPLLRPPTFTASANGARLRKYRGVLRKLIIFMLHLSKEEGRLEAYLS